jgi:hypothetical protein
MWPNSFFAKDYPLFDVQREEDDSNPGCVLVEKLLMREQ